MVPTLVQNSNFLCTCFVKIHIWNILIIALHSMEYNIKCSPSMIRIKIQNAWSPGEFAGHKHKKCTYSLAGLWVIPCQINKEFRVTSRILTKFGVFVVPMVLITHANF